MFRNVSQIENLVSQKTNLDLIVFVIYLFEKFKTIYFCLFEYDLSSGQNKKFYYTTLYKMIELIEIL